MSNKNDCGPACVCCGIDTTDERHHVHGLFGTTKHQCPPRVLSAKKSAQTRHEEPLISQRSFRERLNDGFEMMRLCGDEK